MDTLALLCNLHADGPATLHRLRRVGCESLGSLLQLDPAGLAARLDWQETAAERFLREAQLLSERLDEEVCAGSQVESDEDEDEGEELPTEQEWEEDRGEAEPGYAPPPERVEALLGAWRELDRVSPPAEPEYVLPQPVADQTLNRSLEEVQLEGLSHGLRGRLTELGVLSLRGLAEAGDVELARAIPLGFTRLKHLQFLAARELAALDRSAARMVAGEPFQHRGPELGSFYAPSTIERRSSLDTAGPFA